MPTAMTAAAASAARPAASTRKLRPLILITPDLSETPQQPTESEYVVRANYAEAITSAGGIPMILPYGAENIEAALTLADGILLTGSRPGAEVADRRRDFERRLVAKALEAGKPLFGICHGMQLIGECLGGEFLSELPAAGVSHIPQDLPDELAHEIVVEPGSLLSRWAETGTARVNSLHRHGLSGQGRFRVTARAPDGIIEAFEGETEAFCLGVQWHPEYRLTVLDSEILKAFVARSAEAGEKRRAEPDRGENDAVHRRLTAFGLALPEAAAPPGAFAGAVRTGNIVTVSGQVPLIDGAVRRTGQLGADVSIEEGRECARICLLNVLAQLERASGGFDKLRGFVRLAGYVAATADFTRHGAVVDGASELLRDLFPDRWEHARIAIGVSSLPRGVPVEIELTALVADEV
ncbi:putative glutamine amidotransferase [Rhizobium leguminosarum bv. trifolii WSM2297]|uniref:Putative glutamine amidotransferase n=1 Tax=Rhizobium leguminosarum bv. trifolii WSM2297 TaxID=754762 RepID=J0W9D0_RHILT|nr:Atu1372/SO_1960 family protein [Rhizobium leguminosarum]EJC82351.1 putative glutamine amidotransferase [Rhizobium leguminosarum bv. trifolii WSM2297]